MGQRLSGGKQAVDPAFRRHALYDRQRHSDTRRRPDERRVAGPSPSWSALSGTKSGGLTMGVTYIPVARVGELAVGAMKEVDLGGRQVLLAFVEGKYFAFSRQCPHEEADLKTGTLEGGKVRCTNHNYCFDLRTGECILPKGGPPLTVLPAEERGAEVCIRLEWERVRQRAGIVYKIRA